MSRTDKTRPWWVQMADAPMRTCKPHHDHRFGPCTLPATILGSRDGCHWVGTESYWYRRCESKGAREWAFWRRVENRRDRHQERQRLYTARRECGRLLDLG